MYLKRVEKVAYYNTCKFELNEKNLNRLETKTQAYLGNKDVKLTQQDILETFQYKADGELEKQFYCDELCEKITIRQAILMAIDDLMLDSIKTTEFAEALEAIDTLEE